MSEPKIDDALLAQMTDLFAYLRSLEQSWPLLTHLNAWPATVEYVQPHARFFKAFKDVVILGTGGSSLGGQALTALREDANGAADHDTAPTLHFIDNIDAHTFAHMLETLDPKTTAVLAISKSGNTAETLTQVLTLIQTWGDRFSPAAQMRILTEPNANAMRAVAAHYQITCLDHPLDVGGRFSVFTAVGLLPAMIAGVDCTRFCEGALDTYMTAIAADAGSCAPLLSAVAHSGYVKLGVSELVIFAYADRLSKYADWFCQLWAESLGKKDASGLSHGTTPVRAIGTIDQHSQLQLYLDGPKNKHFTVITSKAQTPTVAVDASAIVHPAIQTLHGHTLGALMLAEQQATIDTLRNSGCPVRAVTLDQVDAYSLGTLMMNAMLETLLMAQIWHVDPFNQPAVEDGKVRAFELLGQMKSA
jgi:glucose-6-phosphate isomerase